MLLVLFPTAMVPSGISGGHLGSLVVTSASCSASAMSYDGHLAGGALCVLGDDLTEDLPSDKANRTVGVLAVEDDAGSSSCCCF